MVSIKVGFTNYGTNSQKCNKSPGANLGFTEKKYFNILECTSFEICIKCRLPIVIIGFEYMAIRNICAIHNLCQS